MTKSKYCHVYIVIALIPFVLFNAGCLTVVCSTTDMNMVERFDTAEKKVESLLGNMEKLNAINQELKDKLIALNLESERLSKQRVELTNKQLAFESLHKPQKTEREKFKEDLLRNSIRGFEENLNGLDLEKERLSRKSKALTNKQSALDSLQKSQKNEREKFEDELLKTRNSIQEFKDKLKELMLEEEQLRKGQDDLTTLYKSDKEGNSISDSKYVAKIRGESND